MPQTIRSNKGIAALLDRIADLLEAKRENPFRIRSWRAAAASVLSVRQSLALEEGPESLTELKGVGERLAGLTLEYVTKRRVTLLDDLQEELPAQNSIVTAGKKAWLLILSKEEKGYKFTVMFSNTTTAHRLERRGIGCGVRFKGEGGKSVHGGDRDERRAERHAGGPGEGRRMRGPLQAVADRRCRTVTGSRDTGP